MFIRVSTILILIIISGCIEISKPRFNSQELLECILSEFINYNKPFNNANIIILDMENWTDTTSYISINLDTENLLDLDGEYWKTSFQGINVYQFLSSVDTNLYRNPNNLANTVKNNLKWKKYTKEKIKDNDVYYPYDPPKIDFIYNKKRKCIKKFFVYKNLHNILNNKCDKCK